MRGPAPTGCDKLPGEHGLNGAKETGHEEEYETSRRAGYIRLQRRYLSNPLEAFTGYLQESVAKRSLVKGSLTASANPGGLTVASLEGDPSKRPR